MASVTFPRSNPKIAGWSCFFAHMASPITSAILRIENSPMPPSYRRTITPSAAACRSTTRREAEISLPFSVERRGYFTDRLTLPSPHSYDCHMMSKTTEEAPCRTSPR